MKEKDKNLFSNGKVIYPSNSVSYVKENVSKPLPRETNYSIKSHSPVNPTHYKGDLVMRICEHFNLGCHLMNTVKYILRAGSKIQEGETKEEAEIRDLNKAKWYIDRRIMFLEGNDRIGKLD